MTTAPEAPPVRGRNPFAIVSIVLAAAVTVLLLGTRAVAILLPRLSSSQHLPPSAIGGVLAVLGGIGLILAAAAIAVGAIGMTRPRLPHALAAAGLAVGCTAVGTYLLNLLTTVLVAATVTR